MTKLILMKSDMAYRFTNTDKWQQDAWFSELKPLEKLLFIYLCENCDIAGFIEYSKKRFSFDTGIDPGKIDGALEALGRGLIWSMDKSVVYIKNFLKHQRNLPLSPNNNAHVGIIDRLENRLLLFGFQSISDFYCNNNLGATEGLVSPISKGNSKLGGYKGGDSAPETFKYKEWKNDYSVYEKYCSTGFYQAYQDEKFLSKLKAMYPEIDVVKSMEASYREYWSTEIAWEKKRKTKSLKLDWKSTIMKTIKINAVKL